VHMDDGGILDVDVLPYIPLRSGSGERMPLLTQCTFEKGLTQVLDNPRRNGGLIKGMPQYEKYVLLWQFVHRLKFKDFMPLSFNGGGSNKTEQSEDRLVKIVYQRISEFTEL
jgi:hypothetical protein